MKEQIKIILLSILLTLFITTYIAGIIQQSITLGVISFVSLIAIISINELYRNKKRQ